MQLNKKQFWGDFYLCMVGCYFSILVHYLSAKEYYSKEQKRYVLLQLWAQRLWGPICKDMFYCLKWKKQEENIK